MSDLSEFRDHCARMAAAQHKPECRLWVETNTRRWCHWETPDPTCRGCLTDADRALFAQMAGEVDDYLAPQVDLFGEETIEPSLEDA